MDKSEAFELLEQIKANRLKLNSCARHEFGKVVGDRSGGPSPRQNMRTCAVCGGTMDDRDVVLYARGYKAAGGNPDDVMKFVDGDSLNEQP